MAKFKFIGQSGADKPTKDITAYGVTFPPGQAVEVTDENAIRKLQGNGEFEQVGGTAKDKAADYTGPEQSGKQPKVAPAPDAAARSQAEREDLDEAEAEWASNKPAPAKRK